MKKWLLACLVLPLALTSCLDTNDDSNEENPLYPGYSIYNTTAMQNRLALVPADAALRLAILLAEADAQNRVDNPWDVMHDGNLVRNQLFSNVGITYTAQGSRRILDFSASAYGGKVIVQTNGAKTLDETSSECVWEVSTENFQSVVNFGGNTNITYKYANESGRVYLWKEGNTIQIRLNLIAITPQVSTSSLTSSWSGEFELTPPDISLTYSSCHAKEFKIASGLPASGRSCFTLNSGGSATSLEYSIQATYVGTRMSKGTEVCRLTANYDPTYYLGTEVKIEWTDATNGTMTYNGISGTVTR